MHTDTAEAAVVALQEALHVAEKAMPADHPEIGEVMGNLGLALQTAERCAPCSPQPTPQQRA